MPITYDNSASAASGTLSNFTVGAGNNRLLLVGTSVNESNTANRPITGITYGGVALTKIGSSDSGGGSTRAELWYLIAPAVGTANVVVSFTGGTGGPTTGAISLAGVNQGSPIDRSDATPGSNNATATASITPTVNNCWVVGAVSAQAIATISVGTERYRQNISGTNNGAGATSGPVVTPISTTITWNLDHGDEWRMVIASIAPFVARATGYFVAPTTDFYSTTLKGQISVGSSLINLASIGSLQTPGYVVIDRTNTATPPTSTPSVREVVAFGSIASTNILTALTRAADGSPTVAHSDGALVESVWTTGMWNNLATIINSALDIQGLPLSITSPVSIQGISANTIYTSVASIGIANIITRLDVSSASVTGLGFMPIFTGSGAYSGPTTAIGGLYIAPRAGTLKWVSAVTRYVASGTSVGFDFQVRNTSIFANATTRPAIPAGGTFVSTASIATLNINSGDILQANVDSMGSGLGLIREISVQGGVN